MGVEMSKYQISFTESITVPPSEEHKAWLIDLMEALFFTNKNSEVSLKLNKGIDWKYSRKIDITCSYSTDNPGDIPVLEVEK